MLQVQEIVDQIDTITIRISELYNSVRIGSLQ